MYIYNNVNTTLQLKIEYGNDKISETVECWASNASMEYGSMDFINRVIARPNRWQRTTLFLWNRLYRHRDHFAVTDQISTNFKSDNRSYLTDNRDSCDTLYTTSRVSNSDFWLMFDDKSTGEHLQKDLL